MPSDIQVALDAISQYQKPRKTLIDYYDGIHSLAYATEKFESAFGKTIQSMRDNLCATVVDAGVDRMEIIGFSGDDEAKKTADAAWQLWQNSQMELTSINTHTEALKSGVAFVIVWPDVKTGKAKFWLQNSLNCAVIKDAENDEPQFAAKMWTLPDGNLRLNLFYANEVRMYATQTKPTGDVKESSFVAFKTPKQTNPYGVIPMFEFTVEPILGNVLPLQDALNKTLCDKLVAMEFAAFPQRWATGLEVPKDSITGAKTPPFKAGVDRVWNSSDKDSKFGDFSTADLEQFLKVADSYRLEMARVSGTPLHYFSINTSDAMSGEALKTLESRFTKRITRNNLAFGPVWSDAMKLALKIENQSVPENLTVQWASPEQRSEKEFLETLGLKRDILDIPVDTLREEAGASAEQIKKWNSENELMPGENEDDPDVNDPNPDDAGTN